MWHWYRKTCFKFKNAAYYLYYYFKPIETSPFIVENMNQGASDSNYFTEYDESPPEYNTIIMSDSEIEKNE